MASLIESDLLIRRLKLLEALTNGFSPNAEASHDASKVILKSEPLPLLSHKCRMFEVCKQGLTLENNDNIDFSSLVKCSNSTQLSITSQTL